MKTWVTVSNNGRIDGKTRLKSAEAVRGFTGGVEVLLTDRAGNILHQTDLRDYGSQSQQDPNRELEWRQPPLRLSTRSGAVVIHQTYEPKVRVAAGLGWIKDHWDEIYALQVLYQIHR